jgi:hypothetical protein
LLIYAKQHPFKKKFHFCGKVETGGAVIKSLPDDGPKNTNRFELMRRDTKRTSYILCASSLDDKNGWIRALSDTICKGRTEFSGSFLAASPGDVNRKNTGNTPQPKRMVNYFKVLSEWIVQLSTQAQEPDAAKKNRKSIGQQFSNSIAIALSTLGEVISMSKENGLQEQGAKLEEAMLALITCAENNFKKPEINQELVGQLKSQTDITNQILNSISQQILASP